MFLRSRSRFQYDEICSDKLHPVNGDAGSADELRGVRLGMFSTHG